MSHFIDAAALAESAAALCLLVVARLTAVDAIGIVFAVPLIIAVLVRIARGLYFAATGRTLRLTERGQVIGPPVRLGRPSWERRPNVRCS